MHLKAHWVAIGGFADALQFLDDLRFLFGAKSGKNVGNSGLMRDRVGCFQIIPR
jgi:hypothetical protein